MISRLFKTTGLCLCALILQGKLASGQTETLPSRLAPRAAGSGASLVRRAEQELAFIPEVVAKVDNETIAGDRIKAAVLPNLVAMLNTQGAMPSQQELHEFAVHLTNQLVEQKLLFQACRRAGYEPDMETANRQMFELEARLGEERFEQALKEQRISREQFLRQTADTIALNHWFETEVLPGIEVKEEEVEEFYRENREQIVEPEQVEVSHILIAVQDKENQESLEAAETRIREIAAEITGEDSFAAAAEQHSDCPSGREGGRLPPFGRGEMVPPFEAAAFASQPGQISDPVQTDFGFHLILSHNHSPRREVPFEEAKGQLKQMLTNRRVNATIEEILEQQRQQTEVEILLAP